MGRPIFIDSDLFISKAWLHLSNSAKAILMIFMIKRQMMQIGKKGQKHWVITNNGSLTFTYKEAEQKYHIKQREFHKAIDCLFEHGFIEIVKSKNSFQKQPSLYLLEIDRWRSYGTINFKEKKRYKRILTIGFCKPIKND